MDEGFYIRRICASIEKCIDRGISKFYIYPYGHLGMLCKKLIETRYGFRVEGVIDNNLSKYNSNVLNFDMISPNDFEGATCLLISVIDLTGEIVEIIPNYIPDCKREIVDFTEDKGEQELFSSEDIVYRGCKIGKCTYGYKSFLSISPFADIGRFCSINGTALLALDHELDAVTTSPFYYYIGENSFGIENDKSYKTNLIEVTRRNEKLNLVDNVINVGKNKKTYIGNDVWIGANVVIKSGVKIGDGAIIGAGAVVTKDVEPYSVVVGVPARVVRKRFNEEIIKKLLEIRWWNWSNDMLKKNVEYFFDPVGFINKFCDLDEVKHN